MRFGDGQLGRGEQPIGNGEERRRTEREGPKKNTCWTLSGFGQDGLPMAGQPSIVLIFMAVTLK